MGIPYRDHLDATLGEFLGRLLGGIAGDTTDLEFLGELGVREDGLDDGPTLVAGGTKNSDELRHDGGGGIEGL
jgi:hypothetical protein